MFTVNSDRMKLITITTIMVIVGLLFVYSAGSMQAIRLNKIDTYFLVKQLVSLGIGVSLLMLAYSLPLSLYRRLVVPIFFFTMILLIVVFFQKPANGAHRWIMLPIFSYQPSEFAKFTVVLYLAHYLDKKADKLGNFTSGFLPATLMVGFMTALIMLEPDFGTTFLIVLVAFTLFVAGGVRGSHIVGMVFFVTPILAMSLLFGYRKGRLLIFLDPWAERYSGGYQLVQSLSAVGSGGVFGKGIGNSTQKLFFLPEAHTDFIYAIVAEETGLIGAFLLLFLIVIFFKTCINAALRHTDKYKKLLMIGITCMIFYQSTINVLVVLGMIPTKGITLPFISYGGSALMTSLFFVGVLLRGMKEAQA